MFRDRIREVYDRLSPSYQRLAAFLLDRYQDAAFMNATQLARVCDLDAGTTVRFAQVLGYRGYLELQAEMQAAVKADLGRASAVEVGEAPGAAVARALTAAAQQLQSTTRWLEPTLLERALSLLDRASETVVVGEGESVRLADLFAFRLRRLGMWADAPVSTAVELALWLRNLRAGMAVVVVAAEPPTPDLTVFVRLMREREVPVLALVGAPSWDVARLADCVLAVSEGAATLSALTALLVGLSDGLARLRGWSWDGEEEARRALLAAREGVLKDRIG